jgi:hypothetical protein
VQIELSSASIASHDTVNDGGRFTVFNIEIKTKMGTFTVARRYSEFRDLYDNLNKASQQRAHTDFFQSKLCIPAIDSRHKSSQRAESSESTDRANMCVITAHTSPIETIETREIPIVSVGRGWSCHCASTR